VVEVSRRCRVVVKEGLEESLDLLKKS